MFNLAILDAQHAWQNRDLAFVQDKNGIHIFFDSKHKDRPWWLKRKRICKNCINFYSSQTNLFVIQIDVNSSLIYYVSVVRGTHKNVCVPWSKNTSPGSINTLLIINPVLWKTCVIDQKGEVSLGLSPDQQCSKLAVARLPETTKTLFGQPDFRKNKGLVTRDCLAFAIWTTWIFS